jgi:transcriptional regulator with XRE-family HTH domain
MATTLNEQQAAQLGALLRTARNDKGLSMARLAEHVDIAESWLLDLEKGRVRSPGMSYLARLTDALEIDAASVDIVTGGLFSRDLPGVRTYFRGRESLPSQAVSEIEAAINDIRKRYRRPDPDATPAITPEDRSNEDIVPPGHKEPRP